MNSSDSANNDFLTKLSEVIEANLSNPQFGVSMLAKEMGMGRHNLYRKVNSIAKITVSQFINQVRLTKAREILRHTSDTVSNIAYKVGYNNVSYFIKCFHEYYGYSPGEVGKREKNEIDSDILVKSKNKKLKPILVTIILAIVLVVTLIIIFKPFQFQQKKLENTIAILPPRIEIQDTIDLTMINGILHSINDNLSKIKDIKKVTPSLSVQQFENSLKPASKIASELNVNYVIKPTVRNPRGKPNLSITLIEGLNDKLLWTDNYDIDSNNVTTVHLEIIKDITDEIDVSITPAEQVSIGKLISSNKRALNYYWEGVEVIDNWRTGRNTDLVKAKTSFEKAIKYDNECAAAYAQLARTYFLMDFRWNEHTIPEHEILYGKEINEYADKAMRYDSRLDLSLIAKGLYYINEKDYELAISYLEDALIYNPNSYQAISNLCNIYSFINDYEKFTEYALRAIDSNFPEIDINKEPGKERIYNLLGRRYRNLGFFEKALRYFDLAIEANPDYLPAVSAKSQVLLDLDEEDNYQQSAELLLDLIQKDSSYSGTYYSLGLSYYILRDYSKANIYFKKWFELNENSFEDYSGMASGRLAVVFTETGEPEKALVQINKYRDYAEFRKVPQHKSYFLTGYYSYLGDTAKAIEHIRRASKYDQNYARIRLLKDAPIYDNIQHLPEFQQIISDMQTRWQVKHDSIRIVFEKKSLL